MLLFWPLLIPFLTAVATLLAHRSIPAQRILSLTGALALLGTALVILGRAIDAPFAEQAGGWPAPFGITLVADGLSATLVTLTAIVALATALSSFVDVTGGEARSGHYPLVNALFAGICGAFLTGDIFNMYVWFEVILISSFGLLVVGGGKARIDGALKYAGLNLIATFAFISGVGLLYGTTGALNMADLHGKVMGREHETAILVAAAFLLFSFGAKAALFPVFFWLPAAYHTPSLTTSALFAALLTKVGVYALFRVFTLVFPIEGTPIQPLLLWGAALTMLAGGLGALAQTSLRRTLNFTIISSIGIMILGLALHAPLALMGGAYYLFQDILVKANLFLVAGATSRLTGSEAYAESGGLWRARPWLAPLFLIPALSLAGIPPFPGFWGKLILVRASLDARNGWLTAILLVAGLLTLLAMARIWAEVFWKSHPEGDAAVTARLPLALSLPLVGLTALLLLAGLWAAPLIDVAQGVGAALLDPSAYVTAVLGVPR